MINTNLEVIILGKEQTLASFLDQKDGQSWRQIPYDLVLRGIYFNKSKGSFYQGETPLTNQQILEIINGQYGWRLNQKGAV